MMLEKEGKNLVADKGKLSDIARKMIAGILDSSDAITAFGNTIPTSYFRLVPNQEAPTRICWGDRNRSVVVRVPLGWSGAEKMVFDANPAESESLHEKGSKQTFEYRVADGSADVFLTLASLIIASLDGIKRPDALELAEQLYVDVNIFKPEHREKMQSLKQLPLCCADSAEALKQKRALFEENHIFPAGFIDSQIKKLQSYNDKGLSEKLFGKQDILKLVEQFLHIG
jgi:glutamine synthetase